MKWSENRKTLKRVLLGGPLVGTESKSADSGLEKISEKRSALLHLERRRSEIELVSGKFKKKCYTYI